MVYVDGKMMVVNSIGMPVPSPPASLYFFFLSFFFFDFVRGDLKDKTKKLTRSNSMLSKTKEKKPKKEKKSRTKSTSSHDTNDLKLSLRSSHSVVSLISKSAKSIASSASSSAASSRRSSVLSFNSNPIDDEKVVEPVLTPGIDTQTPNTALSPSSVYSSTPANSTFSPTIQTTETTETDDFKLSSLPLTTNETTKTVLSTNTINTLVENNEFETGNIPVSSYSNTTIPENTLSTNTDSIRTPKSPIVLNIPNFTESIETKMSSSNTAPIKDAANAATEAVESLDPSKPETVGEKIEHTVDEISKTVSDEIETLKKEIPTSKDVESFFEKIKKSLIAAYSSVINTTASAFNCTSKSILSMYNKTIDFNKYYYSKLSTKVSENPLIAYDALYLTLSTGLGTAAYLYHDSVLAKKACTNCHTSTTNELQIAGAVAVCLSIMGVGNYLYLKKSGKKA